MLELHPDALDDLRALAATRREEVSRLLALFEQLRLHRSLREELLRDDGPNNRDDFTNARPWFAVRRVDRLQAWRLKFWQLEREGVRFRMPYIWNWKEQRFVILAIVPREDMDYDDPNHPIRRRVVARIRASYPWV